jgi:type IV pilus assembly protein PilB
MNLDVGIHLNDTITDAVVNRIREYDDVLKERPAEDVTRRCSSARILAGMGSLVGIPVFLDIKALVDRTLLEQSDPQVMGRSMFIPLQLDEHQLMIAVANPWDATPEDVCAQKYPDVAIVKVLAPVAEINKVLESVARKGAGKKSDLDAIEVDEIGDEQEDFNVSTQYEEPLAQFVAQMMSEAVRQLASDVHIKCEKERIHYSYRIDGDMQEKHDIPLKLKDRLDAFLLNLMGLAPEERSQKVGISGRFTLLYLRRPIDIRFERHRTYRGYHVTMRILDKSHFEAKIGMGSLAFDENTIFELDKVMAVPAGIIVMSGPTGSGKSTTLNAMLRELNRPEDNILTLENPVEDEITGVMHCDLKRPEEFKPMIASFMRSDPDIILMGEVRDYDSAELAIEAAITGHKVLTTIHCPRASQIIERFEQVGIERWKIAQTLKAACAQRLVKTLCPYCKIKKSGISERERNIYNVGEEWLRREVYVKAQDGCGECSGRGYAGRTAILEIIPITPEWSDSLSKGTMSPYEMELAVRKQGVLPSLKSSGLRLVEEGRSDFDSLRKVIDMLSE